ncbi:TPPP family protein CG45057 [Gryllus bimaculatus]|nr:TPPP family protein CG45057 [Gryllus bimaculatus]
MFARLRKLEDDDWPPSSFEVMFTLFTKLAEPQSDGTQICLTTSNRWMKLANVLDGKVLRETDTGRAFFKFKRRAISFDNYLLFLQDICEKKRLNINEIKEKMKNCPDPRKVAVRDETSDIVAKVRGIEPEQATKSYQMGARRALIIAKLKSQEIGFKKK